MIIKEIRMKESSVQSSKKPDFLVLFSSIFTIKGEHLCSKQMSRDDFVLFSSIFTIEGEHLCSK